MATTSRRRLSSPRALLLCGTALAAAPEALAQAPNARPQGGVVSAGAAAIAQDAARTRINQGSDRAVIDWRGFDVGRDHTVQFQQPSSRSMTLNRVTSSDPSRIAGRVTANGGIVIVNQSGVIVAPGAQVEAQSVIVTTADIANQRFMAGGRMHFDRPGRPDARIVNEGSITAREAGIAALVAPQVANRGVITARLGTVAIAGAETHVIDLYGDGLMSLEITSPVRQAPADGGALVSNDGVLQADGGRVSLTAAAADGVVQNLVRAGGRISADTDAATGRRGDVVIAGTGGAVIIEGAVQARGTAAGQRGGTVEVVADRVLAANGARIDASGTAGGGEIAFGQTRQGSVAPRRAERTGVAQGAELRADATVLGQGGRIVLHSTDTTLAAGTISARGGPQGGDGGFVEVSGERGFRMFGDIDVSAPAGRMGEVLFDPLDLRIANTGEPGETEIVGADVADGILGFSEPPSTTDAFITPGQIAAVTGNLTLQAENTITVVDPVTKPQGDLTLEVGPTGLLTISPGADVVLGAGNLTLISPQIVIQALLQADAVTLQATTGGSFTGSVEASGAGRIATSTLTTAGVGSFTDILLGGDNAIAIVADLQADRDVILRNTQSLQISGTVGGGTTGIVTVDVVNGNLTVASGGSILNGNDATGPGINGDPTLWLRASATGSITIADGGQVRANGLQLAAAAGALNFTGEIRGDTGQFLATNPVRLSAGRGGITQTQNDGTFGLFAATLNVTTSGDVSLLADNNLVRAIGSSTVLGDFRLAATVLPPPGETTPNPLALNGTITVRGDFALAVTGAGIEQAAGGLVRAGQFDADAPAGDIIMTGANQVAALGNLSAGSTIDFVNTSPLTVTGSLTTADPQIGDITVQVLNGDLIFNGSIDIGDFDGIGTFSLLASGNVVIGAGALLTSDLISDYGRPNRIAAAYDAATGQSNPGLTGGITLAGTINNVDHLYLSAGQGGIVQTGGSITVERLSFTSGGAMRLDRASPGTPNAIGSLVTAALGNPATEETVVIGTAAAGDIVIDNGQTDLLVESAVTGANIGIRTEGRLLLGVYPANIGTSYVDAVAVVAPGFIASTLDAGAGRVSLRVGGLTVAEDGGIQVTGGTVEVAPATPMPMQVAAPDLPIVDATIEDPPGVLILRNGQLAAISASDTLRFGATTFDGATTTTASSLDIVGNFDFAGGPTIEVGRLDLRSLGAITQADGTLLGADILTGQAGGAVTIGNASLGYLDDFSAGGGFTLNAGIIRLRGVVSAPGQVASMEADDIASLDAGRVEAGELRVRANDGSVRLTGANRIDRLGESASYADFELVSAGPQMTIPAGALVDIGGLGSVTATAGSLTVDGTIRAAELSLSAPAGTVAVNGFSAIAFAGGLALSAQTVTVNGLIASSSGITVNAAQSASLVGIAQAPSLTITGPQIGFGGLDASGSAVALLLGGGRADGTLSAGSLRVVDGQGTTLTGSIAGDTSGGAAALGQRFSGGVLLGDPPPDQFDFLFNDCPIGASVCARPIPPEEPPLTIDFPAFTVADNPRGVLDSIDPAGQPPANPLVRLPVLPFTLQPGRDVSEDQELAPPNIRAEDF